MKKTAAKATALPSLDPLDEFAGENLDLARAMMMVFWKFRHENREFTVQITRADLKAFEDCVRYLEVRPQVRVYRPQGLPAQEAIPAQGNRRAVPARAAQPPKNFVVIQMVDVDAEGNCNGFVPIENNEEDLQRGKEAVAARRIRESAPQIAAQLEADIRANTMSNATVQEAIVALRTLAK